MLLEDLLGFVGFVFVGVSVVYWSPWEICTQMYRFGPIMYW